MIPVSLIQQLWTIRRHLHAHPELSGQEYETAAYVADYLEKCQPSRLLKGLGGTGVVATFDSKKEGPRLLFRAELDALPIAEPNSFAHRSTKTKVSHKCGHDGHTTVLLGLAHMLQEDTSWKGKVSLLFQPAEETGEGAQAMLNDPRFASIQADRAFAFHNLPAYPLGQIIWKEGAFTPSVQSIIIKLKGRTAHAAEPANGKNPALALAAILHLAKRLEVTDSQLSDFRLLTPVFLTMGEKAYGVSAGEGEVHFTLRAWTKENMDTLIAELLGEVEAIAKAAKLGLLIDWTDGFKANANDPRAVADIVQAAEANHFPHTRLAHPLTWGEDFGALTEVFTAAMFGIGAGEDCPALHHEDYDFPDELLEIGVRMFWDIINQSNL